MGTYITLVQWTEQGVRGFRDAMTRQEQAAALAERFDGEIADFLWTMGPYDAVAISRFADDETAAAFALALGSLGNVRTTTLRAFDAGEMARIVATATELMGGDTAEPPHQPIMGKV